MNVRRRISQTMRDRGFLPLRRRLLFLLILPPAPSHPSRRLYHCSCSMNRGHEERRAFLDYRGRDLLVLKRVIMRYKTTVRRTRSREETAGDYADERPDSLFLLRRRGWRFRNRDAHTCIRVHTTHIHMAADVERAVPRRARGKSATFLRAHSALHK